MSDVPFYEDSFARGAKTKYISDYLVPENDGQTTKDLALISISLRWRRYDWTNAQIVALGEVGAGSIAVCMIQPKTVIVNGYIVIGSPDTSANAFTVGLGVIGPTYTDLINVSDAKAVAGTISGDVPSNAIPPSFNAETIVYVHFSKTTTKLSTVVGSTGSVYLETEVLP